MKKVITCIGCPLGCTITATVDGEIVTAVEGHTCKRGEEYARKEVINPRRIVTSTIKIKEGDIQMLSVKTKEDIPRGKIIDCIDALKGIQVNAPVMVGDMILKNVAGTGVDVIATKCILRA